MREFVSYLEEESSDPVVLLNLIDLSMASGKYPRALQHIDKLLTTYKQEGQ